MLLVLPKSGAVWGLLGSVRPKPGFSIGNRNQCQILKLVWEPKPFFAAIDFFFEYRKVMSSNTSCLEAHAGFLRLLMKGIFDSYIL